MSGCHLTQGCNTPNRVALGHVDGPLPRVVLDIEAHRELPAGKRSQALEVSAGGRKVRRGAAIAVGQRGVAAQLPYQEQHRGL